MAASEHALTVGQDPFVMRDGTLCLAVGQAGRGHAVPGGHGLRIAGALQPLAVGQRAGQQPGRRRGLARSLVGRGQILGDAEGIWMAGAARLLAVPGRALQDGDSGRGLACHDERTSQADAGRDDSWMPRRELTAPFGQHPLVPGNGLCRVMRSRTPVPQSADLCGRGQPDSRLERRIHKDHQLRASRLMLIRPTRSRVSNASQAGFGSAADESGTTAAAWASASGSQPSASVSSMAPCRWAGFTLSRSARQFRASRALKNPTGTTRAPRRAAEAATSGCVLVIRSRPEGRFRAGR
jgi:hypothetical protein